MMNPKTASSHAKIEIPFLDLRAQYSAIGDEIRAAIDAVLSSQQFVLGPEGERLEQEVAAYCDANHGVGLANGTDALTFALAACGVGPGDEVIVPAFSFVATATSIVRLGARPVFADIDPKTFNLAPEQIAARRTPRTKAVMPVHLYGLPAEMNSIGELASRHGIAVVEDNAQAIGARYHGARTGSFGAATGISFYPTKNLGAYGDAGMLVTNSEEIAGRARRLRDHGQASKYVSSEPGWNSRLDEIQAAILRVKLRKLDVWTLARQTHASRYNKLLSGLPGVVTPVVPPHCEHVYHLYTLRIESGGTGPSRRDFVKDRLATAGIASAVYYPVPLPLQPLYASHGNRKGDFPASEHASQEVLSLPIYPELSESQIERVAEVIREGVTEG